LRRPTAIIGACFLALAGGIFANALFLQSGRHPAPLFSTRAELRAEPRADVRREPLVEAVQAALRDRGFYAGPLDGVPGPQTKAAIKAFEAAAGRLQTGNATALILAAITATHTTKPALEKAALTEPASVGSVPGDERVAVVQGALSRAAYGQITPDGVMGQQTQDAIRRFQADHGLT
jgi:peptidoglycan hydrolase-like protein with peptidoglycan-binding domain